MYSHVVLLRGVNVGGAKRVPMVALTKMLYTLGCDRVRTLLNSGNALVSVPEPLAAKFVSAISESLGNTFGFEIPAIVISNPEFQAIVKANKLISASMNPSRLLVIFAATGEALCRVKAISDGVAPSGTFLIGKKAA